MNWIKGTKYYTRGDNWEEKEGPVATITQVNETDVIYIIESESVVALAANKIGDNIRPGVKKYDLMELIRAIE